MNEIKNGLKVNAELFISTRQINKIKEEIKCELDKELELKNLWEKVIIISNELENLKTDSSFNTLNQEKVEK